MAEGQLGNICRFDGRKVKDLANQKDVEALVQCLQVAFIKDGDALACRFLDWLEKQPQPRPKYAICCVLGKDDFINTKEAPWIVVPENECPFPVNWELFKNPDTQLLVYVQVALYSGGSVKSHAFHTIAEPSDGGTGRGSEGNK